MIVSVFHKFGKIIKKQTMLVILRTVACVASSLTRANSTVCPPWATSMPQYLRNILEISLEHNVQNLAEFFVQTWWIAQTAHSCTASSC